jgi:hypothetical protein
MFYNIIQRKRDEWLRRDDCPIKADIAYIERKGMMRDAQIEAIKTYLFLKIACSNKPLWRLFTEGDFLTLNLDELSLTTKARNILSTDKAAATLYEYACQTDDKGNTYAPELKKHIEEHPDEIDYVGVFKKIFYGVAYPDYIFSLPMGAGKTYLMAAFIYLDLYYSGNEPNNPAFAHNFMILAPSGLKSSILPSIKNIQDFDPTWVLPEPSASQVKKEIMFEVLDEQKSAQKSNTVRNPNAQKINNHQPLDRLRGLVVITNAEKVILNKFDDVRGNNPSLYTKEEWKEVEIYNELRNIIARIPHLSIFIDEVHHASDGDIKLRQVVNDWATNKSFNTVLGFSGTPYLPSADAVEVTPGNTIQNKNLSNVVYYYPLIEGVGNFLKSPTIMISTGDYATTIRQGVTMFLDRFGDKVYANGTCAKVAIYCGQIAHLEENVYPLVAELVTERGLNPTDCILKYHGGNKDYAVPEQAATEFASLDTSLSHIKIILLAQIGKEGWDCKSLTGVILPQKGACPKNMVLQTSCRCLRQVVKHEQEEALIWLNDENAKVLNDELGKQQHTSIDDLNNRGNHGKISIQRFSRMEKLQVPPIDFYQLKVSYNALVTEEDLHTADTLASPHLLTDGQDILITEEDITGKQIDAQRERQRDEESLLPITFGAWLHTIVKESFGTLKLSQLRAYQAQLHTVFDSISEEHEGTRYLKGDYDHRAIRANIRKAFIPVRTIDVKEEVIPEQASLLRIEKFTSPIYVSNAERFYPDQEDVMDVMEGKEKPKLLRKIKDMIDTLQAMPGQEATIQMLLANPDSYTNASGVNSKTYHYLPYQFDSQFEISYFSSTLLSIIRDRQLEAYFNGDDQLTEFIIKCYKRLSKGWKYLGKYVPDFLLLSRDDNGAIRQVLIVETKGEGFDAKFADNRVFMSEFVKLNNEKFGYPRFDFLYIKDSLSAEQQNLQTIKAIESFFN